MTLLDLLKILREHLRLVIALPVICTVVVALVSFLVLPNTYTASVSMYVLAKSSSSVEAGTVSNSDLSASQMITSDVSALAKSSRVTDLVASKLGLDSLAGYSISVQSQSTTRVLTLSVTGQSQTLVADIANETADTLDEIAQEVMDVSSVNIIDKASAPSSPSGPPRLMYTGVGFLTGLFLAIFVVVVMDFANVRVRNVEEASVLLDGIPVIGRIPLFRN